MLRSGGEQGEYSFSNIRYSPIIFLGKRMAKICLWDACCHSGGLSRPVRRCRAIKRHLRLRKKIHLEEKLFENVRLDNAARFRTTVNFPSSGQTHYLARWMVDLNCAALSNLIVLRFWPTGSFRIHDPVENRTARGTRKRRWGA